MNKFFKILITYYVPYFAFLAYSVVASPGKVTRLLGGIPGNAISIYGIAGLLIVPLLAFGIPSAQSIKAEVLSHRVRRALGSKLQITAISLILALIVVLAVNLVPPNDALSLTFDVVVFVITSCVLLWMRFGRRSN